MITYRHGSPHWTVTQNGYLTWLTPWALVKPYGHMELGLIIGWGSGLSPVRRQATTWLIDDSRMIISRSKTVFQLLFFIRKWPHGAWAHHWLRQWLIACAAPSHYLTHWWLEDDYIPVQERISITFFLLERLVLFRQNVFQNIICKMTVILSRHRCVKIYIHLTTTIRNNCA